MAGNKNSGRKSEKSQFVGKVKISWTKPEYIANKPAASGYWDRMYPQLLEMGIVRNIDFDAFCKLCELYSMWRKASDCVEAQGLTYESTSDRGASRILKRPEVEIMMSASKDLQCLEKKFGLTPLDAKQVKGNEVKKNDELDEFLN